MCHITKASNTFIKTEYFTHYSYLVLHAGLVLASQDKAFYIIFYYTNSESTTIAISKFGSTKKDKKSNKIILTIQVTRNITDRCSARAKCIVQETQHSEH